MLAGGDVYDAFYIWQWEFLNPSGAPFLLLTAHRSDTMEISAIIWSRPRSCAGMPEMTLSWPSRSAFQGQRLKPQIHSEE